jgi:hypothetical protein
MLKTVVADVQVHAKVAAGVLVKWLVQRVAKKELADSKIFI